MSRLERELILASTSPRRRELLREAGFDFIVSPPRVVEGRFGDEAPESHVVRLAGEKSRAVATTSDPGKCILGADTIVVLDDDVLGKPADPDEACRMLLRLAGRTHRVLTGVALAIGGTGRLESHLGESRVRMRAVTAEEARAYAECGEPLDKAGGYALQGKGAVFVSGVEGSRSNVIGLPLEQVVPALERLGVRRRCRT